MWNIIVSVKFNLIWNQHIFVLLSEKTRVEKLPGNSSVSEQNPRHRNIVECDLRSYKNPKTPIWKFYKLSRWHTYRCRGMYLNLILYKYMQVKYYSKCYIFSRYFLKKLCNLLQMCLKNPFFIRLRFLPYISPLMS